MSLKPYGQETEWRDELWAKKHKQPKKSARQKGRAEIEARRLDETVAEIRREVDALPHLHSEEDRRRQMYLTALFRHADAANRCPEAPPEPGDGGPGTMTDEDLKAIEERVALVDGRRFSIQGSGEDIVEEVFRSDVPALVAEIRRLRAIIQEAADKTTDRDTVLDLERALL